MLCSSRYLPVSYISIVRTIFSELHRTTINSGGRSAVRPVVSDDEFGRPLNPLGTWDQVDPQPGAHNYAPLLRHCGNAKALAHGKSVHARIIATGHDQDRLFGNLLVQMYGKCGDLNNARTVLANINGRDVFSWTFMIRAYVQQGQAKEALQSCQQMQHEGVVPNKSTFPSLLAACSSEALYVQGKHIHASIADSDFEKDVVIGTALVHMYGKFQMLEDAQGMFNKLTERNIVSWNAMIAVYTQQGNIKDALRLSTDMLQGGIMPDQFTVATILAACSSPTAVHEARWMHAQLVIMEFGSDAFLGNALIHTYGKCGSLEDSEWMFNKLLNHDVVSWTMMITQYVEHGQGQEAVQQIEQMQLEGQLPDKVSFVGILSACAGDRAFAKGKQMHASILAGSLGSDVVVGNALVSMYGKWGSIEDALMVFDSMPEQDVISWTSMISACAFHGKGRIALQLYEQMQLSGVIPNKVTFTGVLDVCASQEALSLGKQMHATVANREFDLDITVWNAIVNMYGKCKSLNDARFIFDNMPERDLVSWNSMMASYAQYGECNEALLLFQQMHSGYTTPDNISFIIAISACASKTSLNTGKEMHIHLTSSGIELDVFLGNALVNMYGKCGSLTDAQKVFDVMTNRDVVSWNSLIACYAQHGLVQESLQLFQKMHFDGVLPDKASFGIVLFACSHTGLLNEGCEYFMSMSQDHGIIPTLEHHICMVDLLGRVGRLEDGEILIKAMPFNATASSWMALLSACKMHVDVERGHHAAMHAFHLDPENAVPSLMLSSIYAFAGKRDDVTKVIRQKILWAGQPQFQGHLLGG